MGALENPCAAYAQYDAHKEITVCKLPKGTQKCLELSSRGDTDG